jgi:CheY-like chemotaxis protein
VDDERFFLDVVREHLELMGYRVVAFRNSPAALEHFRENIDGFDVIITDQTMPEMTGIQLTAEIRKYNRDIPIILCTGYSEGISEQTTLHFGISKILMKPVSRRDIALTVNEALQLFSNP